MGRPKKVIIQPKDVRTFEQCIPELLEIINKHRHKWHLTSVPSLSWEDISQILISHIFVKFHLYDQSKSLKSWANQVCHNRLINALRDNYSGFARPCLRCPHYQGDTLCNLFGEVTEKCDLYAGWMKSKRNKYNIHIPLPIENHTGEVENIQSQDIDIDKTAVNLHKKMKEVLKPFDWKIYNWLFIQHKSEEEIGKLLKYKSNEKNRSPGYKQLSMIKKKIMILVKEVLSKEEIEIIR